MSNKEQMTTNQSKKPNALNPNAEEAKGSAA
jgi:hypothetical protein